MHRDVSFCLNCNRLNVIAIQFKQKTIDLRIGSYLKRMKEFYALVEKKDIVLSPFAYLK